MNQGSTDRKAPLRNPIRDRIIGERLLMLVGHGLLTDILKSSDEDEDESNCDIEIEIDDFEGCTRDDEADWFDEADSFDDEDEDVEANVTGNRTPVPVRKKWDS